MISKCLDLTKKIILLLCHDTMDLSYMLSYFEVSFKVAIAVFICPLFS